MHCSSWQTTRKCRPTVLQMCQPLCTTELTCVFGFSFIDFRERGMEGEREGEKYLCERSIDQLPTNCADWGPNPQHSHVLWLGIEPMTFQIARWCPSNWITPARVWPVFLFHKNCAPFLCQVKSHSSFECRLWGITSNTVHLPLSLG